MDALSVLGALGSNWKLILTKTHLNEKCMKYIGIDLAFGDPASKRIAIVVRV